MQKDPEGRELLGSFNAETARSKRSINCNMLSPNIIYFSKFMVY